MEAQYACRGSRRAARKPGSNVRNHCPNVVLRQPFCKGRHIGFELLPALGDAPVHVGLRAVLRRPRKPFKVGWSWNKGERLRSAALTGPSVTSSAMGIEQRPTALKFCGRVGERVACGSIRRRDPAHDDVLLPGDVGCPTRRPFVRWSGRRRSGEGKYGNYDCGADHLDPFDALGLADRLRTSASHRSGISAMDRVDTKRVDNSFLGPLSFWECYVGHVQPSAHQRRRWGCSSPDARRAI